MIAGVWKPALLLLLVRLLTAFGASQAKLVSKAECEALAAASAAIQKGIGLGPCTTGQANCSGCSVQNGALVSLTWHPDYFGGAAGSLPAQWSALTTLKSMDLTAWGDSRLNGTLPEQWSALLALTSLALMANALTGTLPVGWSALGALKHLDLSANQLDGPLPAKWSALTALTSLHLEDNRLDGAVPPEWGKMTSLKTLYLKSNTFCGSIPEGVSSEVSEAAFSVPPWDFTDHLFLRFPPCPPAPPIDWRLQGAAAQPQSLSAPQQGIIVGAVLGALLAVAALFFVWRRYRRSMQPRPELPKVLQDTLAADSPPAVVSSSSPPPAGQAAVWRPASTPGGAGAAAAVAGSPSGSVQCPGSFPSPPSPQAARPQLNPAPPPPCTLPSPVEKPAAGQPAGGAFAGGPPGSAAPPPYVPLVAASAPSGVVAAQPVVVRVDAQQPLPGGGCTDVVMMVSGLAPVAGVLCLQLALEVLAAAERVVANHARCGRLVERVGVMLPFLRQLGGPTTGPAGHQGFQPMLQRIELVLQDTLTCVKGWCEPKWGDSVGLVAVVRKLLTSQWYQAEFIGLNDRLSTCVMDLSLALNIKQHGLAHRPPTSEQLTQENRDDAQQDFRSLAWQLVSEGGEQVWDDMTPDEQVKLQELFQGCQLDLTETLRQARKDMMEAHVADLAIPRADVQLGEVLGQGGFGTVYRGEWEGIDVAVKVLHVGLISDYMKRQIQREAHIMHKVQSHPNICSCLGLIMDPCKMCALVMQYQAGGSLQHLISDKDVVLGHTRVAKLALDIARGMAYLHTRPAHPIVHGDLKPGNVLLTDGGSAAISDFGLSRIITLTLTTSAPRGASSVHYMAPELLGAESSRRTMEGDVYAFGITLYEMIMRKPPYHSADMQLVLSWIKTGHRPAIPAHAPAPLATLLAACWHQDPTQRPTFPDIVTQLVPFVKGASNGQS